MFVVILDVSMVNLAGPTIRDGLELSSSELSIVVDSYLIAFAGLLLLGGRIADVLGGRRVFLVGLAIYITASVLSALALTGEILIAGRVLQGIGAAVITPSALSIVVRLYPDGNERARALGVWGAVAGAGSLLGVLLGGFVTEALGWQSVFWIPVPITIVVGALVVMSVPSFSAQPGRFDFPGALAVTVATSALAMGMISAPENGWDSPLTLGAVAIGVVALVGFVLIEQRSSAPLVPLTHIRRANVVTANSVMLLVGATTVSLFFFLPQFQQGELEMSPGLTGLSQLPLAVMIVLASLAAPPMARRLGSQRAMSLSLFVLLAGLLWLTFDPTDSGFSVTLLGAFLLIGAGIGLSSVHATTLAVRDAAAHEAGLLSGLLNAARQLGGAVGLAVIVGVSTVIAAGSSGINFATAFLGLAVFALLALAMSLVPLKDRSRNSTEPVETLVE